MIDRSTNIQAALRSRQRGFLLNPFRFGGGGGGGGVDPHFANVSLLMHMDGTDGGTTFVDSGPLGLTPITVTSATTRPGSAVYGSGGMLLTGASANGVTFTHPTAFQFAANEAFTIEMRVRLERPAGSDYDWLLHMSSSGGSHNTGLYMRWSDAGFSQTLQCAIADTLRVSGFNRSIAYNNYASIAYCRKSDGMTTLFVNGAGVSTASNGLVLNATHVRVGCALNNSFQIMASVDELRITKGVCRYTANYTPAAEAFPNS